MNTLKTVCLALVALALFSFGLAENQFNRSTDVQKIQWHDITELGNLSGDKDKKIIVDIYTDWCKPCKMMDTKTFTNPSLVKHLNSNYQMVKFNAETRAKVAFKEETYKFVKGGRRGYHELAAKLTNGRLAYPSFVVLNPDLSIDKVIVGYKDAATFKAMISKDNS